MLPLSLTKPGAPGVDQGRLNIGRHGLIMTIKNVLNEQNITYSMPTFRGGGGYGPGPMGNMSPPSQPVQQAVSRASQAVCSLLLSRIGS